MLFPIGDDNTGLTIKPLVNYLLILINIVVFIFLQGMGHNNAFTYAFSAVPAEILTGTDIVTKSKTLIDQATGQQYFVPGLEATPINVYLTVFTAMFMHGGWIHLLGNMLYLLIFGDNIENKLGHLRYLLFYLCCGVLATITHVLATFFTGQDLLTPSLGASGAIAGVLGAYMVLFPRSHIKMLLFFLFQFSVPAWLALGIWIALQINSVTGINNGNSDGVAYAAHIGGFIAGMLLIRYYTNTKRARTFK